MLRLYTEKQVQKLIARLKQQSERAMQLQLERAEELREENRTLRARLSEIEVERGRIADVLLKAEREGERIVREREKEQENSLREALLLSQKCAELSARLNERYPDEADVQEFAAFVTQLKAALGENPLDEETGFNMDDVIAPKYPLDLGKLCKDLGLMEEEHEEL